MQAAQVLERPDLEGVADRDRRALAALWAGAARSGAADVPVLAELVVVLTALGAPVGLVGRAARCSAEQVASTARAIALASAYGDADLVLPPQPALLTRTPLGVRRPRAALRRLALRALRDGCLVGGHVAQVTCWAAATSTDPAARAALRVVAAAEASATGLWCDVLTWALQQRPRLVVRLRRVDLAERSPIALALQRVDADPVVLAAHGWPRTTEVDRMWAAHRAAVAARLG